MLYDDLHKLLGPEDAGLFIFTYSGQRIWITTTPSPQLIKILGPKKAALVCAKYGGERIVIPTGRQHKMQEQRRRVMEMHRQGLSADEMAKVVGCSRRTIFRWLRLPITVVRA